MAAFARRHRGILAFVTVAAFGAVGAAIGVWDARSGGGGDAPVVLRFVSDEAGAMVISPSGESLGRTNLGDADVQFPAALANLPFSPTQLAIDPSSGDLWFLEFTYSEKNALYRFDVDKDRVESFAVPASFGSELFSAIAVDQRGHVISAEGFVVLDFEPSTETYKEHTLVQISPYQNTLSDEEAHIADIALGNDNLVYVSRLNVAAVTELNLESGQMRDLPLPKDFGQAYDIELTDGVLWVTSRWDVDSGPPAQTGNLDPKSGRFTVVPGKTTALDAGNDHVYAVSWDADPKLVSVTDGGLAAVTDSAEAEAVFAEAITGFFDHMAVDQKSGTVWVAGDGSGAIARFDPSTGSLRSYEMPSYETLRFPHCPEDFGRECPTSGLVTTRVRGLAVSPDGDVWFSDGTRNRIGFIEGTE